MSFSSSLISWYEDNKRDLPFRGTKDPYLIWISEVILQQTRMEQGIDYYLRFIEQFPDIRSLALASEEEVLKTWQGMGYYSRARNLHASAKEIVEKLGGEFPGTYSQIMKLKGVGDYSAASIASLAFDEPQVAVDGNVYRFLARYVGFRDKVGSTSGKKRTKKKADMLMDKNQPGIFNQAMIEFGALVCTPQKPSCHECIFNSSCYAFRHRLIHEIPVKKKKTKIRKRFLYYLVMTFNETGDTRVILKKREGADIWRNLYDFPFIESTVRLTPARLMNTDEWNRIFPGKNPVIINISEEFRHMLSHQIILATFYHLFTEETPERYVIRIPLDQITSVPLPRLITNYWQKYFH